MEQISAPGNSPSGGKNGVILLLAVGAGVAAIYFLSSSGEAETSKGDGGIGFAESDPPKKNETVLAPEPKGTLKIDSPVEVPSILGIAGERAKAIKPEIIKKSKEEGKKSTKNTKRTIGTAITTITNFTAEFGKKKPGVKPKPPVPEKKKEEKKAAPQKPPEIRSYTGEATAATAVKHPSKAETTLPVTKVVPDAKPADLIKDIQKRLKNTLKGLGGSSQKKENYLEAYSLRKARWEEIETENSLNFEINGLLARAKDSWSFDDVDTLLSLRDKIKSPQSRKVVIKEIQRIREKSRLYKNCCKTNQVKDLENVLRIVGRRVRKLSGRKDLLLDYRNSLNQELLKFQKLMKNKNYDNARGCVVRFKSLFNQIDKESTKGIPLGLR